MPPLGKIRSAFYLDFDNVFLGLYSSDPDTALKFARSPEEWVGRLAGFAGESARWFAVRRCYMNPSGSAAMSGSDGRISFARFRTFFTAAGFDVIDCPPLTMRLKNAADIRIALDIMDLVQSVDSIDEIVLASSDSDFTPLLSRLRMRGIETFVVTAGQAARAYVSVADGHLDESGLALLVNGATDESAFTDSVEEEAPAAGESAPVEALDLPPADLEALLAEFREFVSALLAEASGSVKLATVGMRARERFGTVIDGTRWYGRKSLSAALGSDFSISGHWLYDPTLVDPEDLTKAATSVSTDSRGGDIAAEVLAVEQVVGMPRLTSEAWAQVFQTLETYASTHTFNLTECTAWTRDQLAAEGTPVGRAALGWAVRGARYGGADLGNDQPPTALEIATGVYRNSVYLAQQAGLELTPDELDGFARHLGLEEAPSDER